MASSGYQNQQWYQRPKGCPSCQAAGRGESCDHCHVSGSRDHWARGCRKRDGGSHKVAVTGQVFKQCSGCEAVQYCGHKCQKHHWSSHKGLCQAIQQLEAQRTPEVVNGDGYVFNSHLTPKQQITVAKLVGKKCMVSCVFEWSTS